jgi:hypothetical protein
MPQTIVKPVVTSTSAPKTASDYQSAAMAALTAAEKGNQTQTTTPPAQTGAVQAKGTDDGGATDLDPKDETSAANQEPDKKTDDKPEFLKGAFDKLTTEKAALRKERESFAAERKELEALAAKGAKYADAKTPMELLRAAGFSWKDAAEEMTGLRPEGEEEPEKPTKQKGEKLKLEDIDPEAAKDLAEFRAERARKHETEVRAKLTDVAKAHAEKGGEKFKFVAKLGEYDKALDFINEHFAKHGELPGATPTEAMEIALTYVEANLRKEAEKWKGVLTGGQDDGTQESADEAVRESAVSQAESDRAVSSKTLTNTSGGRPTNNSKQPSSPEEYRAAALAELTKAERR